MKHARVLAPVLLFVLLASAGTVWLTHVARGGAAAAASATRPAPSPGDSVPAAVESLQAGSAHPSAGASAASPAFPASPGVASPAVSRTRSGVPAVVVRPATPAPGAPPIPVRAIHVGGVTLDDTNPHTMCYAVRNLDSPVTIRITALTAGNPDAVVESARCVGVLAEENPPRESWTPTFPCRVGTNLLPHGDGCYTGIEPRSTSLSGDQVHSTFMVSLRARCTSAAGLPCQFSGSPAPTVSRPVDVTFTQKWGGTDLCIGLPPSDTAFCVPDQTS